MNINTLPTPPALAISHSPQYLLVTHGSLPVFGGIMKSPSRYKAVVQQEEAIGTPHDQVTLRIMQEGLVLPVWGNVDRIVKHLPELAEIGGWGEAEESDGAWVKKACDRMEDDYEGF